MKKTQAPLVPFVNCMRSLARICGRSLRSMLLAMLFAPGLVQWASAQGTVPEYLSFQGYMEDATGVPLGQAAPTNYFVVFRIYPMATGGLISWSERQNVTFDKGNYSVLLGQGSKYLEEPNDPLSTVVASANGSELYVESIVTINGTPATILPRLRLLPTPYAFLAKKALNADSAANASFATNAFQAVLASQAVTAQTAFTATFAAQAASVSSVNGSIITTGSIPQTALAPGILAGLTDPIPDSRLSNNVARTNRANIFNANQTVNGILSVNGTSAFLGNVGIGTNNPTAPLDVNGEVKIKGEKPFAFKMFSGPAATSGGNSVGAFVDFDTGWPTNKYFACIVGFHANRGDINEYTIDNTMITVRVVAPTAPPFNWRVQADLRNEGPQVTWRIMAMRVVKELVTDDSWGYANWP